MLAAHVGDEVVKRDPELVVISPGYGLDHPRAVWAREHHVEVIGEAEYGFRFMRNRCVGVTGTNGKSTAVAKIVHVLKGCGMKAQPIGNFGLPVSEYVSQVTDNEEVAVCELSSFQLETMTMPILEVSGVTNISPDHLERYRDFEEYAAIKRRIGHFTKSLTYFEGEIVFPICRHFGLDDEAIYEALESFDGLDHRLQKIKTVDGISFYDDSKGTNVDATVFALTQIEKPIVLIAGGRDKGGSYEPWAEAFPKKVKCVITVGEAKERIASAIKHRVPTKPAKDLQEAFTQAIAIAKKGDAVLLSPGCSSFDQFEDYKERGLAFQRLVRCMYESS